MSRWRTAKAIRDLLNDHGTRTSTTTALLNYLDRCETESEVCEILTIVFLTSPDCRPKREALASRIHCPSILADIMFERTYGPGCRLGGWQQAHSGPAPSEFSGGKYFDENKTQHIPPIFVSKLRKLERTSGYPFLRQWAYEWQQTCEKLSTKYTSYPHYFDDLLEARAGIMGQYWQRMREAFLSAYLRTLAYAVVEWGLPQRVAEDFCVEIVHGIAGLFDVEPGARPEWLKDFPEQFCSPAADFRDLIQQLVLAPRVAGMRLVSLKSPVASSVQKYAELTLSAHLVTPDYEPPDGAILYEKMLLLFVPDTFELKGPSGELTVGEASTKGKKGDEIAVCGSLFPIPFGSWQGDYLNMGLMIPAPYTTGDAEICCTNESIDLVASGGAVISTTRIWNDNWVPPHPKNGTTRCGTVTMIDEAVLASAEERLGRDLAWFACLRIWERKKEYGEYSKLQRTAFVTD